MLWKEVKTWAKDRGYKADRTKIENEENSYHYKWFKIDDESICGESTSVSKLARIIYNHITDNAHAEYQKEYEDKESSKDIEHEKEGW